jgi:hypothetical protein
MLKSFIIIACLLVCHANLPTAGAPLSLMNCGQITVKPFNSMADFAITEMLTGLHFYIGLRNSTLFSEHIIPDTESNAGRAPWKGFDVAMLQEMAVRGGFTYDFVEVAMRAGEPYDDFLSRACSEVDFMGNSYGDTIDRRGANIIYTARTGKRQDLHLFGPKAVHVPPSIVAQLTSFLKPFSPRLWLLFVLYIFFSAYMMYLYETAKVRADGIKMKREKVRNIALTLWCLTAYSNCTPS